MKKIFDSCYLGSGMAFKTHPCICFTHAAAIINYLHQRFAGIINDKFDFCGACIYRIFQQLLYSTGRSLDHFTGCNLVGNIIG